MAATNKKCYAYAKVLEFLRPTMENRKTESNIFSESSNEEISDQESDREDEILVVGSNESELDIQSPSSSKAKIENRDRKIKNSFEKKHLTSSKTDLSYASDNETNHSPTIHKKLKSNNKKTKTSFESQLISYLHNRPVKEENDPDKLFLLSLLPQIKQLSQDKKTQLYIYFLNGIQQINHTPNINNLQTDFHSSHSQGSAPSISHAPTSLLTNINPQIKNINSPYQHPMFSPVPHHYLHNNHNIPFSQATQTAVNLPQNQPYTRTHHHSPSDYLENSQSNVTSYTETQLNFSNN